MLPVLLISLVVSILVNDALPALLFQVSLVGGGVVILREFGVKTATFRTTLPRRNWRKFAHVVLLAA
jgi:hypothetical protein